MSNFIHQQLVIAINHHTLKKTKEAVNPARGRESLYSRLLQDSQFVFALLVFLVEFIYVVYFTAM